jgi:hypothetical protein
MPIVQLLKNCPAFYEMQMFIAVFTSAIYQIAIQSIPRHSMPPRSILLLSTYLGLCLPSGLFPSGFQANILYAFLLSITMQHFSLCSLSVRPRVLLRFFVPPPPPPHRQTSASWNWFRESSSICTSPLVFLVMFITVLWSCMGVKLGLWH